MESRKRICVFCASARSTPAEHVAFAEEFGVELARSGFDLVWGGCDLASMGALARGIQAHGGKAIGVIPAHMESGGLAYRDADELVIVADLFERKRRMSELSDGFAILPGGVGTLDEFFSQLADAVIDAKNGNVPKKLVVLNWSGFYQHLEDLLESLYASGFADPSYRNLYRISPTIPQVMEYLKGA